MTTPAIDRLSFIGAGIIAEVWMERLIAAQTVSPDCILACDVRAERLDELRRGLGVRTSGSNREGAAFADLVIIATPPSEVTAVLSEIAPMLRPEHLVVSLAAAVPLASLETAVPRGAVLRVMPNTPSLLGEGMNLVSFGAGVTPAQRTAVTRLLDLFGRWFEVDDAQMDYWCALCAAGPTLIFPVLEALAAAAAAKGLPPDRALEAAAQMVAGSARLALHSGKTLPELKRMISLRTLREPEAMQLFTEAYNEAVARLQGLAQRLSAHAA